MVIIMGKFKEKMYRFMYGRYGADELYKFGFWVSLVLLIINLILSIVLRGKSAYIFVTLPIYLLALGIMIWNTCRCYSRKLEARRKENAAFLKFKKSVGIILCNNTSRKTKSKNIDTEQFIFRDCTNCHATLRLARKIGKNKVKCPKCSHSFFVTASKYKK